MQTRLPITIALSLTVFGFGCATAERRASIVPEPSAVAPDLVLRPIENPIPPNPTDVYDMSKVSVAPVAAYQCRPRYPYTLRRAKVEGQAEVSVIVRTDGTIGDVVIVRATDFRFGVAAAEAAQNFRFHAAQLNGRIVACRATIPFVFRFNDEPDQALVPTSGDARPSGEQRLQRLTREYLTLLVAVGALKPEAFGEVGLYRIEFDDTALKIAAKTGATLSDLAALNPDVDWKMLLPWRIIRIRPDTQTSSPNNSPEATPGKQPTIEPTSSSGAPQL